MSKKQKKRQWHRKGKFNRHHIKNKCKGGRALPDNIIRMDIERHKAFHFLFGNMDFEEIAGLLLRTARIKQSHHQSSFLSS